MQAWLTHSAPVPTAAAQSRQLGPQWVLSSRWHWPEHMTLPGLGQEAQAPFWQVMLLTVQSWQVGPQWVLLWIVQVGGDPHMI